MFKNMVGQEIEDEIQNIAATIARDYQPQSIVLFGSAARGSYGPSSDIDLLVVKETKKRPFERVREVVNILPHTLDVDVLVLTPQELEARRAERHYLIQEIDEQGRIIFDSART